jgi:deoxyribonucleoside regulator
VSDYGKREMAEKAAILYHERELSQKEVAKALGVSRSQVSLLLRYAKETGITEVTVNVDKFRLRMIKREIELKEKFPKLRQIYVMSSDSVEFTERTLGAFAAPYLSDMIKDANTIGVNLGASVERSIDNLDSHDFAGSSGKAVVQLMGGFSMDIDTAHPYELVKKLSAVLKCQCFCLNCPAIVQQGSLREALREEPSIKDVMKLWNELDLVIMGIGVADERSKLFTLLNDSMKEEVRTSGACSEVNINFFDEQGNLVPVIGNNRIGATYEELSRVKRRVAICAGKHKTRAVLAALKSGIIDVLVTDSLTMDAVEELLAAGTSLHPGGI